MRKGLKLGIKLGVSAGLVIWAFSGENFRPERLGPILASSRPSALVLALLTFVVSNFLGAVQWRVLLGMQGIVLPFGDLLSLYFTGIFFNNFFVGGVGGDAVRIYEVRRETGRGGGAFAATLLDRLLGFFSLSIFACGTMLVLPSLPFSRLTGAAFVALLASGLAVLLSRRISGLLERLSLRLLPEGMGRKVSKVREGLVRARLDLGRLALAWAISLGVQSLRVSVHYWTGRALGVHAPLWSFFAFVPLIALAAAVPISFGGIGVRENFGALLFRRVGVEPTAAFSMEFLAYLVTLTASLIGGASFVLKGAKEVRPAAERGP